MRSERTIIAAWDFKATSGQNVDTSNIEEESSYFGQIGKVTRHKVTTRYKEWGYYLNGGRSGS
jgi:ribosome maturation factor RimP